MVQRLQTTRSEKDARQAFIVNAAGDALWMLGLSFVGLALFAYFQRHTLPPEFATDKLVPYFMSLEFPPGYVAYHTRIGFLWPSTFGLVATLVVGGTLALLWPASPSSKGRDLTWRADAAAESVAPHVILGTCG